MKSIFLAALTTLIGACSLPAQEPKTEKQGPPPFQFLLADCVAFEDNKLTVKFRLDDNFKSYASARFTYPRQGLLKSVNVGEAYIFTFQDAEAAHNLKAVQPIQGKSALEKILDNSLVAKVVKTNDKSVVVEWDLEDNTKKFFSKQHTFPIRNGKQFVKGQTIKIAFEKDNRHCRGYAVIDEKSKN
jgi:hypothetical protein